MIQEVKLFWRLSHGLPVVCFNLGGPGKIVDSNLAVMLSLLRSQKNLLYKNRELTNALININYDYRLRNRLKIGAINRSQLFSWSNSGFKSLKERKE